MHFLLKSRQHSIHNKREEKGLSAKYKRQDTRVNDLTRCEGYLGSGYNHGRKDIWVQDITMEGRISGFMIKTVEGRISGFRI